MGGIELTLNPIAPWPLVIAGGLTVSALTLAGYMRRLRGSQGAWRWLAVGFRFLALLMCLLAMLRPSILVSEKKKQPASVVFLVDTSRSMTFGDEANAKTRADVAQETLKVGRDGTKDFGANLDAKFYRFDSGLAEISESGPGEITGKETALGPAMLEAEKRQGGRRIAEMIVISDFAANAGTNPLVAARRLKNLQVPVHTIALGTESAGAGARDLAIRDFVSAPTVFVKNQLDVKGTLTARGFSDQPIDVELLVDGQATPVAKTQLRVPPGSSQAAITGLKYVPQTPGEKMITLRVVPKDGELSQTNNEISTFITVQSGGLNVLYLHGATGAWERRFLAPAIRSSPDILVDFQNASGSGQKESGGFRDELFAPGRYNAYILGDLPADALTAAQQNMLKDTVTKGAGLMMLGGRQSFGPGGWGQTPLAQVLPFEQLQLSDGQIEPEGGIKFVPRPPGIAGAFLQIGPSRAESDSLWSRMPALTGANRFEDLKKNATIFAVSGDAAQMPLMVGMEAGGRVLAVAGETWVWARASDEGRLAHRKFWRQVIFWLCRKEDQGDNQIKLKLDSRRIASGQRLGFSVTAKNAKGETLTDVRYEASIERDGAAGSTERVDEPYSQGDEARGGYDAKGQPGRYKMTVVAKRADQEIGRDSASFLVYQDDRELENPAANLTTAKLIAEATGGKVIPPQRLAAHLKAIDRSAFTEYASQIEHRLWDNWPFFLLFTAFLTLEWWVRKRHGWV